MARHIIIKETPNDETQIEFYELLELSDHDFIRIFESEVAAKDYMEENSIDGDVVELLNIEH